VSSTQAGSSRPSSGPAFPTLPSLRAGGFAGLRVVGDVHGDSAAFAAAIAGAAEARLFVLQLGDLTDYGPDAPGALRLAFALLDAGAGRFLLGNHDHKLRRALTGARVRSPHDAIPRTLDQLAAVPDGRGAGRPDDRGGGACPGLAAPGPLDLRPCGLPPRHAAHRARPRCRRPPARPAHLPAPCSAR
jgi:protein phosphatase